MKELIALRPLTYGAQRLRVGDSFCAQDAHARLLVAIGRARPAGRTAPIPTAPAAEIAEAPPGEEPGPKRRKRAYRRRDMRAED